MTRLLSGLAAATLLLSVPVSAHDPAPQSVGVPSEVARAVEAWRASHGSAWRASFHADSGLVELLYGGSSAPSRTPLVDADFEGLAREAVAATRAMHGVEPDGLVLESVRFLPLGQIGSTDKWAVRFEQRVGSLRVHAGSLNCLFDAHGRLLALHAQAVPNASRLTLEPLFGPEHARRAAAEALFLDEGHVATEVTDAHLEVTRLRGGASAWRVEARSEVEGAIPVARAYWIGARDGAVLDSERTVHEFEVRGNVRAFVSPGLLPDTSANPEVATPMRYIDVTSSAGTVRTDANGDFVFPGVNTSLSVTVRFTGAFNDVENVAGSEYALTSTIPANQNNTLTMNPSSSTQVTAQGNAFHHVNVLRDWIRSIVPTDATADFVQSANVNLSQTCNAYFDGGSTNYFLAGGGCVNTAFSTVIAHEHGHWLNVRYGTGNGMDGMGEGNADVFAMFAHDTPVVGQGFCGTNCSIRSGLNTRQFCGDLSPACYGEVHADGEVWMGAAWKVRARLNTLLGNAAGDLAANTLFLSWMNAFNQSTIRSIIESQWLVLDDDDGNLNDGTPHHPEIDGAFREQGFPGFDLVPVTVENVSLVPDSIVEVGPYAVDVDAAAHFDGATLTSVELSWRVNGGAFQTLPLVPQGGTRFGNSIPPVPTPAQVDYFVTAADSLGNTKRWPDATGVRGFRVGATETVLTYDFESGDQGWTHGTYGDTSNPADEWERGHPGGATGSAALPGQILSWRDPSAAFSGTNCFGVDLGNGTNGNYGANVHVWLRSPIVDCSTSRGTRLALRRWLSVQYGAADQARIRVNGTIVWSNPEGVSLLDQTWVPMEVDISTVADSNPSVRIEFELRADGVAQLGGWNVDDVAITRLGPAVDACNEPTTYGPGKVHSGGEVATLDVVGDPSLLFGPYELRLGSAVPDRPAMLYSSHAPAATALLGGTLLLAQPLAREAYWIIDGLGGVHATQTVQPFQVGTTRFYQCVFRDPANPDGSGMGFSRAVRVRFCP